jgi:predicted ester cyclase
VSLNDNKGIVRRFFGALNENRLAELESDLLAPSYRLSFDGHPPLDRQGALAFFGAFLAAFPGIHHSLEDQFAEGDRVATRIIARGRHQGDFMGMSPTGKEIAIGAINIHRFEGDKIVEQWVNSDALGLLQQLGVIPAPGGTSSH